MTSRFPGKQVTSSFMNTTIILIRHGLTDWNEEGRWQGHKDIPLNATGIAQAKALGRRLASWPIAALYSSDLLRAAQTAAILGQAVELEPIHDRCWRERDVGAFQGLTWEEIAVAYPNEYQEMRAGIIDPPRGEDSHALHQRAVDAFSGVARRHPQQMVAVVSHGGFLHTTLLHVLGLPIGEYGRLSLRGNTGISIVEINNGHSRLSLLNDTAHLERY
jgi:broad specificity phosphatase PhoE